jgi:hypothetical protein
MRVILPVGSAHFVEHPFPRWRMETRCWPVRWS